MRHSRGEIFEDVVYRDPQASNTRFPAAFARLDRDYLAVVHPPG